MKLCMWWTVDRKGIVVVDRGGRPRVCRSGMIWEGFGGGKKVGQSAEQSWSGAAQGRAGQATVPENKIKSGPPGVGSGV